MPDSNVTAPPGNKRNGRGVPNRPKLVNLNLIPPEFRRPLVTKPRLLAAIVMLSAAAALPQVYSAQGEVSRKVDGLRRQFDVLKSTQEGETKRIAKEQTEAARLEDLLTRLKDEVAIKKSRTTVETGVTRRFDLAPALEILVASEALGLEVTSVRWQEPNITVQGHTPGLPAVMSYTSKLQDSRRFRDLRLRLLEEVGSKTESAPGPAAKPGAVPTPVLGRSGADGLTFELELELAMNDRP